MTGNPPVDVARNVAVAVARYLDWAKYDSQAAAEDVSPDLCLWLGALIGRRLEDEEDWEPLWSIDGACPQRIESLDALTVDIAGTAWTLGDSSLGYKQPFRVTLRLTPSRDGLTGYTIRLGDAALGLGCLATNDKRSRLWPDVDTWHYVIEG